MQYKWPKMIQTKSTYVSLELDKFYCFAKTNFIKVQ